MKFCIEPTDVYFEFEKIVNPIDIILEFIVDHYPVEDYPKILEIAAGSGNFSSKLANLGYQVTAMDPKLPISSNVLYQQVIESFCLDTDISEYDLGIAIHPCGIHKDIISNFKINEKALFLIPCCTFSCEDRELIHYKDNQDWLDYLKTLNPKMKEKVFFNEPFHSFSTAFYTQK